MIATSIVDTAIFIHHPGGTLPGELVSGLSPLYSPFNFIFILVLLPPSLADDPPTSRCRPVGLVDAARLVWYRHRCPAVIAAMLAGFPPVPTGSAQIHVHTSGNLLMAKIAIFRQALVFVGDGQKVLFLRNLGDERFPNLAAAKVFAEQNPPTHEQGTDLADQFMLFV
jgi:hypothetical protein